MNTESPNAANPLNLVQACWQNKGKMLIVFALVMVATVGILGQLKLKYTSEAKLFIRLGKETIGLDPTATVGQTVSVQEAREKEIHSVQSLVHSRNVLERVVDNVGIDRILEKTDGKEKNWLPIDLDYIKSLSPVYVDSPRDTAIAKLEKQLVTFNPRSTAIIGLRYETISPELAAEVLQEVIESSIDAQVRVHQSAGSNDFFLSQTRQQAEEVAKLEDELLRFKNETGVSELTQHRQLKIAQIASLQDALMDTIAKSEAVTREIESRTQMIYELPARVRLSETTGLPSSAAQGMREQLYSLQMVENELVSRYQPDHPKVRQTRAQIAAAQETLESEHVLTQVTMGVNESRREMESALLNQQAIADSLAARKTILTQQIAELGEELKEINQSEITLAQISRKLDLARASYQDYAKRSELARLDVALSLGNLSNLSVLQQPSDSKIPSSPKVALTLVMGTTIAIFLSLFVGVVSQWCGAPSHHMATTNGTNSVLPLRGLPFAEAANRFFSFRWL
ncbi:Chain length determinant protein [Rosistilla carotiformis]|uniref:Chain length determinant protein n=1 Tax=Rosistilla carotiformis TaxID=2528017 RepID=A0A518K1W4_9BACT|nr:lipopolysaccharide biosynthesis protein [Rosistilla carotiformis]QDV71806.1 Chain length determinant protein [Rosistilla carotiformis]